MFLFWYDLREERPMTDYQIISLFLDFLVVMISFATLIIALK